MRLSICIPTYNRAEFLGALFDSILSQRDYGCQLEVVVSDNASTDNTSEIIELYKGRFENLVYYRHEANRGADRNFLKVVDLATGDYCWLMGSDDVLEPGGIATVERAINDFPSAAGIYLNNNSYNFEMNAKVSQSLGNDLPSRTTRLTGDQHIFEVVGEYVGYISANVVKRTLWNDVVAEGGLEQYFNAWIHVYVIGRMMQKQPEWVYIATPCVGWRSGNDSFLADGQYRRLEIDVAGYSQVTAGLFGKQSAVYRHIMLRILRHARFRILHAKAHGAPASFFANAGSLLSKYYASIPSYWITLYPLLKVPAPVFRIVRSVYANTLKRRRVAKANS